MGKLERKILRSVYGPVVEQGMWRIRTNRELRELYKDLDTVADIKKKRLESNGYVLRMDQGTTVEKYLRVNWRKVEGEDLD
jgi:hypothetical protein